MARSAAPKTRQARTSGFTYKDSFEQNEANEYAAWEANVPYIHWHIENARRAAGGADIATIRAQALRSTQVATIERFNQSVYAGKTSKTDLNNFDNAITDINQAVSDSNAVMNLLREMVDATLDFNGTGLSANQVAAKISQTIGGVKSGKVNTLQAVNECLTLLYNQDLKGLIRTLQSQSGTLTPIKQAQLASLIKLDDYLNADLPWTGKGGVMTPVRNTLVDILTEQGLPDFLEQCARLPGQAAQFCMDSMQLGQARVEGKHTQGKIDTVITFLMPDGRKITQGISLKSNYAGYSARILTTTILATLKHAMNGQEYAMVNAASLFTAKELKAWMEWANLDRALQGSMLALKNASMQDRADLLIEFTNNAATGTFQVHNINYLLYKLVQKIKANNSDIPLTKMGFGMADDAQLTVKAYDRTAFDTTDIQLAIKNRSHYTNAWLTGSHTVMLNANALLQALS